MLFELISSLFDRDMLDELETKIRHILLDHQLNKHKGNPQKDIQELVRIHFFTKVQDVVSKINSNKELERLYDAYVDCILYETSAPWAAHEHRVDLDDLEDLIRYKKLPPEALSVSKSLMKKRAKR